MAYAAGRSGARLSVHTAQALVTWPVSTPILYASCHIQKHPDEIKHSGFACSLLSMAFTYQRATSLEACGSEKRLR
jgi:hypothetical protein